MHFENLGHLRLETVKKNIAILWDMPEILEEGYSWETESHSYFKWIADVDDDDEIAANIIKQVNLQRDSNLTDDDDGLKSLTHLQGLFGIASNDEGNL